MNVIGRQWEAERQGIGGLGEVMAEVIPTD